MANTAHPPSTTPSSRKRHWLRRVVLTLLVLIVLAIIAFWLLMMPSMRAVPPLEPVDRYVYLNESWGLSADSDARQAYYFTPQGASVPQGADQHALRYSWFIHLEQPLSTARFADPEFMRRLKFLVDETPSKSNPDHLPVGFTRHFNASIGEDVLDLTCAACHTGELHYQKDGVRYGLRVDGGQAMHAFTDMKEGTFGPLLLGALIETYLNPAKFSRFADNVVGADNPDAKSALHSQLRGTIEALLSMPQNNPLRKLYPEREGYGRTDALGRIANTVFGDHLSASNLQIAEAPVSYPYLWNIWKFNWVQYNGSVSQPLARNIGEALGVGAVTPLKTPEQTPLPASERFRSSVRINDLERIELTLRSLAPPKWPAELFGAVNAERAAQGKELFEQHCQQCHGPHVASEARKNAEAPLKTTDQPQWLIEVIPVEHIGTDASAATAFLDRRYDLRSTGITREQIAEVLLPSLRRQLARNVLYHLRDLAQDADISETQRAWLTQAITEYPAPDQLADRAFSDSPFAALKAGLEQQQLQPSIAPTAENKPYEPLHCDRECQLYALSWYLQFGINDVQQTSVSFDPSSLTEGVALNIVGLLIKQRYYLDNRLDDAVQQCLEGFGTLDLPQQIRGYKPRPLAGVWATPPFLHNGSVPSVYQMLLPPEQRDKRFFSGPRDYDPAHLGYITEAKPGNEKNGYWFDTTEPGNHNTGHGFAASADQWQAYRADAKAHPLPPGVIGPEFSNEQRMAIIEYLKIHQDDQLTPAYESLQTCLADAS
ncbi:c-type cytochrome [Permianibacter aggregans]|uniref:Cytochrome c domain-containing protein n=1 Tax=Permianibacter aggregans TaxID=1510150 RepID=A0A4R6UY30_9GAMM|nr:cytochrome c [Permianibacter aggregans]TDQ50495.1 hypothetical protein EV696_102177 [Permianibacter aggregans]